MIRNKRRAAQGRRRNPVLFAFDQATMLFSSDEPSHVSLLARGEIDRLPSVGVDVCLKVAGECIWRVGLISGVEQ